MTPATCQSRLSNCKNLGEKHEGDLDAHFAADCLHELLGKMSYSKDNERASLSAKHRVPINGNIYNGTATTSLGSFSISMSSSVKNGRREPTRRSFSFSRKEKPSVQLPKIPSGRIGAFPRMKTSSHQRGITIPYVRFLHPQMVCAVVEDNERRRAEWATGLSRQGVDPDAYLWPRCACAFPGVRRYVGSKEIAQHRKQSQAPEAGYDQAVQLDDNNYPKHLWSFAFRGRPFQQFGPKGCMPWPHLVDHKVGKRLWDEIEAFDVAAPIAILGSDSTPARPIVFTLLPA